MSPHRQVKRSETNGVGWSIYWQPPRGLRWLPESEVRHGERYVAYKANQHRRETYRISNCYVCGGRYLTARLHSEFCSNRCTQEYRRYSSVTG